MILKNTYFENETDFIEASAKYILEDAIKQVSKKDYFTLVLSGGKTPLKIYEHLSTSKLKDKFPWGKTYFFISDERLCGPKDPNSNVYQIKEKLFDNIEISEDHIIFPRLELANENEIIKNYENQLKTFFKTKDLSFDLTLLGIGTDGHTASLFPNDKIWVNNDNFVISTTKPVGTPQVKRISFGLILLNSSKDVLMLISGSGKREIAETILDCISQNKKDIDSPILKIQPKERFDWHISYN